MIQKKRLLTLFLFFAFAACASVSARASSYLTSNGYYFWMEGDEAVAIHGCDSEKTDLYFPVMLGNAFITSIDENAFLQNKTIRSVEFAPLSHITKIGDGAFYGCSEIKTVALPQGLKNISESVFQSCTALKSVTLGSQTESVDAQAFYNCRNLETVTLPEGLNSIGNLAFANCSGLTYLELPRNVTNIAATAFQNDSALTLGVYYGSYAHQFAEDKQIPYVFLDIMTLGDVNGDGIVNIDDVTAIQRHLANLETQEIIYLPAADTNQDGDVNISDATVLQGYLAEFESTYPIGEQIGK